MKVESIFADMGAFWDFCKPRLHSIPQVSQADSVIVVSDPQHRWLGPEKGVIALATAAVCNAAWDMFAKSRGKPLWKLIVDFTPEE